MIDIVPPEHQALREPRSARWLATYREAEDLINIGAYARGANATIDEAIARLPAVHAFLRQPLDQSATLADSAAALAALVG